MVFEAWLGLAAHGLVRPGVARCGSGLGDWQPLGFEAPAPTHVGVRSGRAGPGSARRRLARRGSAGSTGERMGAPGFDSRALACGAARMGGVGLGKSWQRMAGRGPARPGRDDGWTVFGVVRLHTAHAWLRRSGFGSAWFGMARCGVVGPRSVGQGLGGGRMVFVEVRLLDAYVGHGEAMFGRVMSGRPGSGEAALRKARSGMVRRGMARNKGEWHTFGFGSRTPTPGAPLCAAWRGSVGLGLARLGSVGFGMEQQIGWRAAFAVRGRDTHASWPGEARHGDVGPGVARPGPARHGRSDGRSATSPVRVRGIHVRPGGVPRGVARLGAVSRGRVTLGAAGSGFAGFGRVACWWLPGFDSQAPTHGPARSGWARLRWAASGMAWPGKARDTSGDQQRPRCDFLAPTSGLAGLGAARCGIARWGTASQGSAWRGRVRQGTAGPGPQAGGQTGPRCNPSAPTHKARPGAAMLGNAGRGAAPLCMEGGAASRNRGAIPRRPTHEVGWGQARHRLAMRGVATHGSAGKPLAQLGW